MKILQLSTAISEQSAVSRLNRAINQNNENNSLILTEKSGYRNESIIELSKKSVTRINSKLNISIEKAIINRFYNLDHYPFSSGLGNNYNLIKKINKINPDVVNLHWICYGFLPIKTIKKIKKPIVWTLHDSWAFTGGCHLPFKCEKYKNMCGKCPTLNSKKSNDLSTTVLKNKINNLKNKDITIVCPSNWLAKCANESYLFRGLNIKVIPNCINTKVFNNKHRDEARKKFNIPLDKKIILFGAINSTKDKNKGFNILTRAFEELKLKNKEYEVVIFGNDPDEKVNIPLKVYSLGKVYREATLAEIYSMSDVYVLPSKSENLPNTIIESMACGTPVVAFNIGGIPDIIDNKKNGYLANPYDHIDLANGISTILDNEELRKKYSENCTWKVHNTFSEEIVAKKYYELYKQVLSKNI